MKKITLILLFTLIGVVSIFAQAPKSFKYQAVVRDNSGNAIANQAVSFRIGIIQDSINGAIVYSETHSSTTNQFGMVILKIGDGTIETGIFEGVNWGTTSCFLKLEVDETGDANYQFMGTSELLSVPYSINSGSLTLTSPGGANYEVSVNDNGTIITTCTPMPSIANAGADQDSVYYPATLAANIPQYGNGLWSIVNGTGGSFFDETNPTSEFYGIAGNSYTLRWTISNACGFTEDIMNISFKAGDLTVDAGPDQIDACSPTNLEGNTPSIGTGLWTIESGTGGTISEPSNSTSEFTGIAGNSYVLRWTITTAFESGFDEVNIGFEAAPTIANAGTDQDDVVGTSTLTANTPTSGTGLWTIISGTGGFISEPTNSTSEFTGTPDSTYTLLWTISTVCENSFDEVSINFAWICGLTLADERDAQTYSTVQIDDQCWMAENLAYLPEVSPSSQGNITNPYYYVYDYQGTDVTTAKATEHYQNYGALYNWPASLNACPTNWHVPTDAEWTELTDYLGGENAAGGEMKSTRTEPDPHPRWNLPNPGATNSCGFSGLPGGDRDTDGTFDRLGLNVYLWSSTEYLTTDAWYRTLTSFNAIAGRYNGTKAYGLSVRCLRD